MVRVYAVGTGSQGRPTGGPPPFSFPHRGEHVLNPTGILDIPGLRCSVIIKLFMVTGRI